MKKVIDRFSHPIRGIRYALQHDLSFKTQFYGAVIVGVCITWYFQPLALFEVLFVTLALFMVIITELQNSALEAALDRMHPERHDEIGRSKDMAAGAVLTAGVFLLIVIGVLIVGRI